MSPAPPGAACQSQLGVGSPSNALGKAYATALQRDHIKVAEQKLLVPGCRDYDVAVEKNHPSSLGSELPSCTAVTGRGPPVCKQSWRGVFQLN